MPENDPGRHFRQGSLIAVILLTLATSCFAQDVLNDRYEGGKQYLITMEGLSGDKTFAGVKGLLSIDPSPPGSDFHYVVTTTGWPKDSERDSFVWDSRDATMESIGTAVRSRIVNVSTRSPNIYFFHLSKALFNREGMLTQHEGERIAQVLKEAKPTKIQALAGELDLTFTGQNVHGSVWLNGYDPIGKSYVRYQASLQGSLNDALRTTRTGGEFDN